MLFRYLLRYLENNISSQSNLNICWESQSRCLWGPRCPWPRLRRPGSEARQLCSVHLNPTDGRLVWAGRLSGWQAASTAWLPNSFPPLGNSRATWVRCKVQNCHLLPPAAKTYLSIQDAEELLTLHPPLHWSTMHRRPKFNWLSSLPPFGPKQAKQLDQPFVLAVSWSFASGFN